jgi:hypothetical protein
LRKMKALLDAGYGPALVGRRFGVPTATICCALQRFKDKERE